MDILFSLFLFFAPPPLPAAPSSDCDSYIVGFRGLNRAFDQPAFDQYADQRGSCSLVYDYTEADLAVQFVDTVTEPYELYGYSAGAVAVGQVLRQARRLPSYVITVGALASVDVNFARYGVRFDNWFDESGRGSRSPGRYIPRVSHDRIQAYINRNSVDVNFARYGVRFDNWFDESGRGSRSPGRYIPRVSHDRIQAYINRFYQ